jgi:hypothetical protein
MRQPSPGRIKIADGDTITVLTPATSSTRSAWPGLMRLRAISHSQTASGDHLGLVFVSQISATYDKRDRYRRIVCRVSIKHLDASYFFLGSSGELM